MFRKKSLREKSSKITRVVSQPINISTGIPPEPSAKPQVAVFVTHGMGQQVPFETLDAAAEGLILAANKHYGNNIRQIRARTVLIGDIKTQRAEFDMRDAQGNEVEVHVYEGYWAPITEGQVMLRDVMAFLFRAGFKGLRNCWLPFERWIFGETVNFGRQFWAPIQLILTLCVVLSLVLLNFVTATVAATRMLHTDCATNCTSVFPEATFAALTSVAAIYVAICVLFGGTLFILMHSRKWVKHPETSAVWCIATNLIGRGLLWLWVGGTIACAVLMLPIIAGRYQPDCISIKCFSEHWLVIWGFLLLASWIVKNLLIQYMGDVAAYVDSHSLDRFDDIRNRIKTTVFEHAKAVYANSQYERIAMMGHSLGSAITYDTLNALINYDALHENKLDVIKRTKLLLTFGSPLDKLAFIFASQINKATVTREALAATLQPLVQAYLPFRNIKWINVYSKRDIVSGSLEFYDDKNDANYSPLCKVDNVEDLDAKIPLAAHIEYWDNRKLFDELYENL